MYGLGYLDTAFLGLRPWTRRDIPRMIDAASQEPDILNNEQALEIIATIKREFPALYTETIQMQGYPNKGFILVDAAGREAKGDQAWFTYHLSLTDLVQASYRNLKVATDFVPGGTTQNSFGLRAVKRLHGVLQASANFQHEWRNAPIYQAGP